MFLDFFVIDSKLVCICFCRECCVNSAAVAKEEVVDDMEMLQSPTEIPTDQFQSSTDSSAPAEISQELIGT